LVFFPIGLHLHPLIFFHFWLVFWERPFPPGGIPALICVDPDDGNGGYSSDNTPAAVGNRCNP
jgi:hypothetical protein